METILTCVILAAAGTGIGMFVKALAPGLWGIVGGMLAIPVAAVATWFFAGTSLPVHGLALGICTVVGWVGYVVFIDRYLAGLQKLVEEAPSMRSWLLENFTRLDTDGDGIITRGDLERIVETTARDSRDYELANECMYALSDIGHVIDAFASPSPMGHGVVVAIYGANRADIESFPARVLKRQGAEYSLK